MEGEWKQRRGKAIHRWGKTMNDDLAAIAGKYEELVGRLQEKYGIAQGEADEQLRSFKKSITDLKKSNRRLVQLQKTLNDKKLSNTTHGGAGSVIPARTRAGHAARARSR
jgi:uncharacterized protein YjbJ (UPF0337 family)